MVQELCDDIVINNDNNNKNNNKIKRSMNHATTRTRDACTIFVRNISPSLTRLDLEQYFSDVGPVKKCSLISDAKGKHPPLSEEQQQQQQNQGGSLATRKQRYYGFVKFCNEYDATRAVVEHEKGTITSSNSSSGSMDTKAAMINNHSEVLRAMIVEHADSNVIISSGSNKKRTVKAPTSTKRTGEEEKTLAEESHQQNQVTTTSIQQKQSARVILRNLSFYATETHVRKAMSQYGTIVDIHLPLVPTTNHAEEGKKTQQQRQQQQHRGFAFVTFEKSSQAHKAISAENPTIKNRPVTIELSISKQHHQQLQKQNQQDPNKESNTSQEQPTMDDDSTASTTSESDEHSDSDNASINSNSTSKLSESSEPEEENCSVKDKIVEEGKTSIPHQGIENRSFQNLSDVQEQRTLFIRNIPFDADRHSLFLLFKQFGKIEGIFIVKDKVTQVCKGTAFIKFHTKEACTKALMKAGCAREDAPFIISGKEEQQGEEDGIFFQGRRLLVDLALDRDQASTLVAERDPETGQVLKKQHGKDRRNLYLKQEGHIPTNTLLWDSLPTVDQEKRQRACSEKSTKLKSPIFFINPLRLSVRNLGKHVTKSGLKSLAVLCTQEGLRKGLVSTTDVTAHLRAQGTLTPRECLSEEFCSVPPFDTKNIKKYIPSVFVNTNTESGKGSNNTKDSKKGGRSNTTSIASSLSTSKGFGFIEFTHHAHALACLRELNNNATYSAEWANKGSTKTSGSKRKSENKSDWDAIHEAKKVSRVIVEFAIENRLKAKQQAERRAHLLSLSASKEQNQQEVDEGCTNTKKKKKGRGSLVREKKRKRKEEDERSEKDEERRVDANKGADALSNQNKNLHSNSKVSLKSLRKKRHKIDKEESLLDKILTNHQKNTSVTAGTSEYKGQISSAENVIFDKSIKKRWFE
jgi:nucleolar protein 4